MLSINKLKYYAKVFCNVFRSAFAAPAPTLGGGSGQLDPATLQARRALAEKLKQEVIGNEEEY